MQEFRFDDVIVSADADDLQAYLEEAYGGAVRPVCNCQKPDGIPMYVAKLGSHYVIKRMPSTGGKHDPDCNSYEEPPELSGFGEVKDRAIQEDEATGTTTLRLDFSLTKMGKRAATPSAGTEHDTVRTDGAKLTLRGLLHYLWDQAALNRWTPGMEGKRNWYVIRKYLLHAALGKKAKDMALAEQLYIPEVFSVEREAEITQRRLARMATLVSGDNKARKLMIAIGEVKEIGASRYGFKLVAKHLPNFPFMIDEELYKKLDKRFGDELALWNGVEGAHLVFIGTFWLTRAGYATLETLSLMVTTANWLPIEHGFDVMLLDTLAAHKRKYRKCLRYNLARNKPLASVLLTDTTPPTALYLDLPVDSDEDPVAQTIQHVIDASELPSWIWSVMDAMPPLPEPNAAAHTMRRPAASPVLPAPSRYERPDDEAGYGESAW